MFGIGCYTTFSPSLDVETLQALHGRAPSLATGVKRMLPDSIVFTVQGDGDMVNEGLQEVIHTAARGERITCLMLNNGVFGETGGQMTATTVIGQRTKTTLEGRNVADHGNPIKLAQILAGIDGTAYVARAATNSAGEVARLRRILHRAFEVQAQGIGFSLRRDPHHVPRPAGSSTPRTRRSTWPTTSRRSTRSASSRTSAPRPEPRSHHRAAPGRRRPPQRGRAGTPIGSRPRSATTP